MSFKANILIYFALLFVFNKNCKADAGGYHYDRPTVAPPRSFTSSYNFRTLPTVVPLPPLPELPPLPTAPSKYQNHFQPSGPTVQSIASSYLSAKQQQKQQQQNFFQPSSYMFSSTNGLPPKAAVNNLQDKAVPQPLRIPYGKQAIVHFPPSGPQDDFYIANGRQLKQYSVVEIIDNDIEQSHEPFLSPFIDSYRARIGATGTGATGPYPVTGPSQIDLRSGGSNYFQDFHNPGAAIALGSGGLGFVRLPNGNVYLGSGSLGYITGEQHLQSIRNARTRTGAKVPDALHFGHGALGDPISRNSVYRYK